MSRREVPIDHQLTQGNKNYKIIVLLVLGLFILTWQVLDSFFYNRTISNPSPQKSTFSNLYLTQSGELVAHGTSQQKNLIPVNGSTIASIPIPIRPLFFLPVSINQADRVLLESIPGIGPHLSQQIVSYREKHGEFTDFQELMDIHGIGKKKLAILQKHTIL